jgi:hypothetical protein
MYKFLGQHAASGFGAGAGKAAIDHTVRHAFGLGNRKPSFDFFKRSKGGVNQCPRGKSPRRGYRRADGTRVRATCVKNRRR